MFIICFFRSSLTTGTVLYLFISLIYRPVAFNSCSICYENQKSCQNRIIIFFGQYDSAPAFYTFCFYTI